LLYLRLSRRFLDETGTDIIRQRSHGQIVLVDCDCG
jgi:hypothetical protein